MPEPNTLQQWEYKCEANYSKTPTEKTLKVFGDEGWELVAIIPGDTEAAMWILYFKRPKQNRTND